MTEKRRNFQQILNAQIPFNFGGKGELLQNRNNLIAARYYFYFHIKRMRPDDVFKLLSLQEFFLKTDTLYRILLDNNDYLNKLISENTSAGKLQKNWPTWKW